MYDDAEFVSDIDEFANLPNAQESMIKGNLFESPALENFRTIDMKLNKRGPGEDEAYAMDLFLMKNIRRGNTVIEQITREKELNEEGKEIEKINVIKRFMGRKGLTKFFDLYIDFVDPKTRY